MINVLKQKGKRTIGQGLVELALTLPIFLLVVYGIFEVGRLIFMYSAVLNASRDAARYAGASGKNASGVEYYRDCNGIKAHADKVSSFVDLSAANAVVIQYDHGPINPAYELPDIPIFAACPLGSGTPIVTGDRFRVTVNATFNPIVPLVGFTEIPITATTPRSILTEVDIWNP